MSLSCYCDDDYDWFFRVEEVERISVAEGKCYGCCGKIKHGDDVRAIGQFEIDEDGDEINHEHLGRLCPKCSGLYDSLIELGFCLSANWGFVAAAMDEYRDMTGVPAKEKVA